MPLPPPSAARQRVHRRAISIEGFRRDDGLFDIEGHLTDIKDFDVPMADSIRAAGVPIHDMKIRITIDEHLVVVDACAVTDGMPYVGACDRINAAYAKLIGQKIQPGFRIFLAGLFGGLKGCTHLTELLGSMAPAALQSMYKQARKEPRDPNKKPFQLDGCHALDTRGETVAKFYPRWYRGDSKA
jgi:Protein of unknown function (DUF2889)